LYCTIIYVISKGNKTADDKCWTVVETF